MKTLLSNLFERTTRSPGQTPRAARRREATVQSVSELQDRVLAEIDRYDGISFDVFDTLLRRNIDPPEVIPHAATAWLARRLSELGLHHSPQELWTRRLRCERLLRQAAAAEGFDEEFQLSELLFDLVLGLLPDNPSHATDAAAQAALVSRAAALAEEASDYELQIEFRATAPVPQMPELFARLRTSGKRLAVCSDMYLSADQIAALLVHHGYNLEEVPVFVSSQQKLNKRSGRLFRHMIETQGVPAARWLHIGDDHAADIRPTRRQGISAFHLRLTVEQTRRRQIATYYHRSHQTLWRGAFVAAAAGSFPPPQAGDPFFYDYGRTCLGFPFAVFAHRLIEQSRRGRADRLLFVARDGFLLRKLYQCLANRLVGGDGPPIGYAALSRRSTDPPNDTQRELLDEYLSGRGFWGSGQRVVLVDIGWRGTIADNLRRLFGSRSDFPQLRGWYFGWRGRADADESSAEWDEGLLFDARREPTVAAAAAQCLPLWEEAAKAPHGATLGYARTETEVVPVFADSRYPGRAAEIQSQPALAAMQRGILDFAAAYAETIAWMGYSSADMLPFAHAVVCRAACLPRRSEARHLLEALHHASGDRSDGPLGDPRFRLWRRESWRSFFHTGAPRWRQAMLAQVHAGAAWLFSAFNLIRTVQR